MNERETIQRMARSLIEGYVEAQEVKGPQRKKQAEARFDGLVLGAHFALTLTADTHIGAAPFSVQLDVHDLVQENPPPDTIAKRTAWSKYLAVVLADKWKPVAEEDVA